MLYQDALSQLGTTQATAVSGPCVIAVDPSGNAVAVWTRNDGTNGRIQAAYRPAGGSFGTPATISDPGGDASAPHVSMDNSGRAAIAWARDDGSNPSVCCLRVHSDLLVGRRQPYAIHNAGGRLRSGIPSHGELV